MTDLLKRTAQPAGEPPLVVSSADLDGLARRSAAVYVELAAEYYIQERHPTCANFDTLQEVFLQDLRPLVEGADGIWLEVGCGRGRLDRLVAPQQVILSDISEFMLALARRRTEGHVSCRIVDAFQPPFEDGSLQGVVAFLADPYNHPVFFSQARRILSDGGWLSFTLPNHDWATAVRAALGQPLEETHFIHRDQRILRVPSLTRGVVQQCELLHALGFRVLSVYSVSLMNWPAVLPSHHVILAARILGCDPRHVPLLDVYIASKEG